MNGIGFRNFRRFKELNSLPLGGINLFVGGNNAGKSTVVKGLLLLLDFLKNQKVSSSIIIEAPKFRFDGPGAHDVNIDTFNRALCWSTKEKEIVFYACIEDFVIEVCIYNNMSEEVGYADVKYIKLEDQKTGLKFLFDIANGKTIVSEYVSSKRKGLLQEEIEKVKEELNSLDKEFKNSDLDINGQQLLDEYLLEKAHLEAMLAHYKQSLDDSEVVEICVWLQQSMFSNVSFIDSYLQGLIDLIGFPRSGSGKVGELTLSQKEWSWLEWRMSDIKDVNTRFKYAVQKISVEYVYSHDANQRVIFNKKDENDFVSQSIHEFYNQRITSESEIGKKMLFWLKEFCDIDDYKVETVQGVAYRFTLKSGEKWIDLADMGRGTIQLVVLFVRLASIIKKYQGKTEAPIVLVEEPEQNLHPAFQSKLTDLLFQVYDEFNIRFIIETHSEYLIRRAQVLVAQANYDEETLKTNNPFKVYYFPVNNNPYDMVFTSTGHFKNPFGTGFLDEAGKSALTISRIERDRNKALL